MTASAKRNKTFKPVPLGALAAGFGLASAALAQTVPAPAAAASAPVTEEAALPVVRIKGAAVVERQGKDAYQATETRIGKGKQALRDIPQSLTIVTEKVMDDRKLDNVKDVLKTTAGITFQAAEGGEEDIKLRGFSLAASGDIFIDGMRDPAFYDRDTFFLDKVEVLRGSAALLFGRGSTGGAVNQVVKQAQLSDENEVEASIGSHSAIRTTVDLNHRTGETSALRVGAMFNQADSNGAGTKIDKQGVAANYRWGIGEKDEFGTTLYLLDNNNGINYGHRWIMRTRPASGPASAEQVAGTTLLPVDPDTNYGMASDRNYSSATYGMLNHTHRFSTDAELSTKVRYAEYTRDLRASLMNFAGANLQPDGRLVDLTTLSPNTVVTRQLQVKKQDMQTLTGQSDLNAKFNRWGFDHALQAGVDFALEKKQVFGVVGAQPAKPTTTIGTPDDGASYDENLRSFRTTSDYVSKGLGVYVQDLVTIAPMWKLLGGLRFDYLHGSYNQYPATGAPTNTTMNVSEWSKRAAVLFQPTDKLSFHFMGATSFNTSGDTYSFGNGLADVPPEQSMNWELGAKYDAFGGALTAGAALFHAVKYNERNTDLPTNGGSIVLSGKRHADGLDLYAFGRPNPKTELIANFTWIPFANIDRAVTAVGSEVEGSRPSLTPRYSGSLWTTYLFTPELRMGAGVTTRGRMEPNRNPHFNAPKFTIFDAMAEYTVVPETLSFRLNVSNIANKRYADGLYTSFYTPGAGRLFTLTGTYKF
jgi:catecholate siderophore receptor